MTNNDIIKYIIKEIDVKKLIRKNIYNSDYGDRTSDLEQYIYLKLLDKNNIYLNKIYDEGTFTNYIAKIILNQRNCPNSYYNKLKEKEILLYDVDTDISDLIELYFEDDYIYDYNPIKSWENKDEHVKLYSQYEHEEDIMDRELREEEEIIKQNIIMKFFMNDIYTGKTEEDKRKFIAINFLALNLGIEICNDKIIYIKKMSMNDIANNFIDEHINMNKIKTKIYLVKQYIELGRELLNKEVEFYKTKYI